MCDKFEWSIKMTPIILLAIAVSRFQHCWTPMAILGQYVGQYSPPQIKASIKVGIISLKGMALFLNGQSVKYLKFKIMKNKSRHNLFEVNLYVVRLFIKLK